MKCHRCDADIDEGPDDDVEDLLIRQLLHDRDCALLAPVPETQETDR